ncbi:MAG TPA: DUF3047 domain-containing protein [Burkholderiales bacterium]|nr:DUF3047 domain-containing protein [Burkholderiales bacterium]
MACVAAVAAPVEVGVFSQAQPGAALPAGWQPLAFPRIERHTTYRLVADEGTTVVRADADASASGLTRRIDVDPKSHPLLAWRWKIAGVVEKADATRKEGDDYAARIYVAFKYDPARVSWFNRAKYALIKLIYGEYPPHAGINYVWDNRLAPGTFLPNAYADRVRMIVVRSGDAAAKRWVADERNVLEDYRRAFDEEPPPVSGVAIMTDTDDTGSRATAWYGDVEFRSAP